MYLLIHKASFFAPFAFILFIGYHHGTHFLHKFFSLCLLFTFVLCFWLKDLVVLSGRLVLGWDGRQNHKQ